MFKMVVLLKLLYLYRTLPIPALLTFFKTVQSHIIQYVWGGDAPDALKT